MTDSNPNPPSSDDPQKSFAESPSSWWFPPSLLSKITRGRAAAFCALLFVLIGLSLTGYRTYRQYAPPSRVYDFSKPGLADFHNGAYLPSMAFRHGVNPYSVEVCEQYTMPRSAPPYSPVVFMLYAPLSYLSLHQADVAFFVINFLLLGLIACFGFTMSGARCEWIPWLWILGMLVFSRPGHITLVTGYFTAQLVIGTLLAIHFAKTRPVIAGLGMLLASGKPTYILPLTILMLCRKNFKAVVIGVVFCVIGAAIGLGWLASFSSFGEVIDGIRQGQAALHDDPTEDPVNTWTRLDTAGVMSKIMDWKPDNAVYLGSMLLLLIVPGIALWRNSDSESNHGVTGLTGMIACIAILITIYHHSYDCLLVVVPWVGITFYGKRVCPEMSAWQHRALTVLLAIPALNYFSTRRFRDVMGFENQSLAWNIITSINGVCLLLSLLILLVVAFRSDHKTVTSSP